MLTAERANKTNKDLPETIAIRTDELAPLLEKWREQNPQVPWSRLLAAGLRKELAPLAGKRYAHLVEN
ncbi:MAG: hypothetical protein EB141_12840 [Verrucomicrobia bacterium]|nr:hypothetical protein [Pseudomonadota bacterium]NDB76507.1 hypothetical protein [Verrucomicrobiota bacterium]NDD39513.1 hypothetical protein [Verrucomicrobiota bacterium]NDE98294.1 hypothetical protein [Verrucomicrobiota bacterium]